jgi:AraC family transcriptional regulator of adaptative response / DNA-3-methyladenine glycosylase II
MAQVAFAAGFESVRRFNALFRKHYRLAPSALRRSSANGVAGDRLRLVLAYRPPFEWRAMLRFLAARATPWVECVTDDTYQRTVAIGEHRGWLQISRMPERNLLTVELATALSPALPAVLARLRNLFDLDARPDVIANDLGADPLLARWVNRRPGLRVPGAFDPFEMCVRAIVGQQVSVRGATTLAGRMAERFGETIETPFACLQRLAPLAEVLSMCKTSALSGLGLTNYRAGSIRGLARAVARQEIDLQPGADAIAVTERLMTLPGVGPWTAQYVAMRALRWPDAFPAGDLGLKKAAHAASAEALEKVGERWRPWRAYAAMHLWESLQTTAD